jgi:ribosomal protein S18 acetylase RimI-like enzyme
MPPPLRRAGRLGIACRPATDADLPILAETFFSTRIEEVAQTGWPIEAQRAFLSQQFDAQHRHYRTHYPDAEWLVLERDGVAIGRLYLDTRQDDLHLIDIALLAQARGSGIGGALLEDLIDFAEATGRSVSIFVERMNPAMRLYERLGFVKISEEGVYDLMERPPAPVS